MEIFKTSNDIRPSRLTPLIDRMRGPGGYYNIGNFIGLVSGLALQIFSMRAAEGALTSFSDPVTTYLIGSPGSTALTLATLVFFFAGELYHRAWQDANSGPDIQINRWADFISGIGALLLAISLVYFGEIWLAITSTILLAGGKFGSALGPVQGWPVRIKSIGLRFAPETRKLDLFRTAVVLSRIPAIGALVIGLIASAISGVNFGLGEIQSFILLLCFLLWTRADILLARH